MSLRINHNIDSIVGQRNLAMNSMNMSKSLQRLSSGLRINSAADNPAGLVISEQMRAQITGLNQAVNNTQNGISMVQTAEGALDEVNSLLNKARQLTLDAANTGVNDSNQLAADQAELDNVIASISRIGSVTQFGTKEILNGDLTGASNLSANLSHVRVGNLANNAAISAGTMTVAVTSATKQSITLNNSGTTSTGAFSASVTGLNIGSNTVNSGVAITLNVGTGGASVSLTTTGSLSASGLATALNAKLVSGGIGYTVAETGGYLKVTRDTFGANPFASSISFTSAAISGSAGTKESITSTMTVGGPSTASGAAGYVFGATYLSGVTTGSTVASGTVFTYALSTATGGAFTNTRTVGAGGETVAAALTAIEAQVQAHASFTGATLALGTGTAGGLNVKLSRETTTADTDFQFALTIDYNNQFSSQSEVNAIQITGAAYDTSGADATFHLSGAAGTMLDAAAITDLTFLASGAAMSLTINGQTVTVTGAQILDDVATAFQTAFAGISGGLSGVNVAFLSGGSEMTGLAGYVGTTGVTTGYGFVIWENSGKDLTVSLKVDQKNGTDANPAAASVKAGAVANVTLDLTTTTQTRASNVAMVSDIGASGASSSTTGQTVTAGTDATATLSSSTGLSLALAKTFTSQDGINQWTLSTAAQDAGYKNFSVEIADSVSYVGSSDTFTLDNGAEFQIGANQAQKVGITIDTVSSSELGRNASTTLNSLDDLSSSNAGALLNGNTDEALKVIDAAIDQVTNLRGKLGAFQANTLQSGLNSLQVSSQNLTAAESTIRDVDFAVESANFTRNQIMVQASTSMLAQANQMPQSVLKLLG